MNLQNWLIGIFGVGLAAYFGYVIYDVLRYAHKGMKKAREDRKNGRS